MAGSFSFGYIYPRLVCSRVFGKARYVVDHKDGLREDTTTCCGFFLREAVRRSLIGQAGVPRVSRPLLLGGLFFFGPLQLQADKIPRVVGYRNNGVNPARHFRNVVVVVIHIC